MAHLLLGSDEVWAFLTYSPQNRAAEPKNLLAVVKNWLLSNGVSHLSLPPFVLVSFILLCEARTVGSWHLLLTLLFIGNIMV